MDSPLKGKVLIASPDLLDPNFVKTVILIVQHDEGGAMGLIINRALETTVGEAWTQVSAVPYPNGDPLFQGGPCEGPLLVLHKDAERGEVEVFEGIWLSSDAEKVKALVDEATDPMKFFVGYAGWDRMQLEQELAGGSWGIAEIDSAGVLATPGDLWDTLQQQSQSAARIALRPAIDPRRIPPDPSVN
jgi:putative transcriptional regulator